MTLYAAHFIHDGRTAPLRVLKSIIGASSGEQQEEKCTKDIFDATSVPEAIMAHFGSQYGAKKIVQEYVAGMVATLRKFSSTHPPLAIFLKFLSEVGIFAARQESPLRLLFIVQVISSSSASFIILLL